MNFFIDEFFYSLLNLLFCFLSKRNLENSNLGGSNIEYRFIATVLKLHARNGQGADPESGSCSYITTMECKRITESLYKAIEIPIVVLYSCLDPPLTVSSFLEAKINSYLTFVYLNFILIISDNNIWKWECSTEPIRDLTRLPRCKKVHRDDADSTATELGTCKLTCGQSSMLFPKPSGMLTFQNKVIVKSLYPSLKVYYFILTE